jgi:hypothetical protein
VRTLARPSAKPSARAAAPRTSIPHEIEMLPSATPSSLPPLLKSDCISSKPSATSSEKPARASIPPPASPPPAARALAQHLGHQLPPRVSMSPVLRSAPRDRSAVVPLRASQPQAAAPNSERSIDPRRTFDAEVALGSALKHLASSRFDHAELELEQLCQLRPGHRDAQIWLRVCRGRRLKAERKAELAQEEYRAVLELDPEHREALENVGPRRRRGGGIGGKWFDGGDE